MTDSYKNNIEIDVEAVAQLAKLSLDNDEKQSVRAELEAIVDFARKLGEVDTTDVDITAHIVPMSNVLREDVVTNRSDRDELLKNAPTEAEGYMTVPRTLE